ncbi:MAG: ABC transporter permease [Gordonia sp. (in: high G+C Gram-positive bacteria)]|uniref:ABC transporter permease n=1 Tax=Gordonia sp. (in: high G+C Gram-positive bacteria) TaxID=84139 RepID=UPI0039E68676
MQTGLLLVVAALAFDVDLPTSLDRWFTFGWVFVLGLATSALLGVALSAVPRSGRSATAVVIPIVLFLQFVSGVYLPFTILPGWLQNLASVFPLKWIAEGMRHVFLPDEFRFAEQGHSWNLAGIAIALGIWLVVGLILARATFRWTRRD